MSRVKTVIANAKGDYSKTLSLSGTLVETSSAYSDFLLCKKSVIRSTVSPLRKKYHSVQLLVCKRTRNAELSLTTFCGFVVLRKIAITNYKIRLYTNL